VIDIEEVEEIETGRLELNILIWWVNMESMTLWL
jgi:hypothetical protein